MPRQKNAQVVILTHAGGRTDRGPCVLLQLRSYEMPVMPGHLATVGGMRDSSDEDSRATALREVWEETGLVDLGRLAGAAGPLRRRASEFGAPPPLELLKFGEGANVDWWVLLLEGAGMFDLRARDAHECEDIAPLLPMLPEGSSLAPCFGHAWVPVAGLGGLDPGIPLMGGLQRRVGEAVGALSAALLPAPAKRPRQG